MNIGEIIAELRMDKNWLINFFVDNFWKMHYNIDYKINFCE